MCDNTICKHEGVASGRAAFMKIVGMGGVNITIELEMVAGLWMSDNEESTETSSRGVSGKVRTCLDHIMPQSMVLRRYFVTPLSQV